MRLCYASFLLFLISSFSTVKADTLHVPKDHPTIQAAIDASKHLDTILAAPGEYMENISYNGKKVTVKSSHGPEKTIINGMGKTQAVIFENKEGLDSVITGFTIKNGSYGGIFCYDASPSILNNIITENIGQSGGGISCSYCDLILIKDNVIKNNISSGGGGGVSFYMSSGVLQGNVIKNNSAPNGGGVSCSWNASPLILNNVIVSNTATLAMGGGVAVHQCSPTIKGNQIYGNASALRGGGVACWMYSYPLITHNYIYENDAVELGGGVAVEAFSMVQIMNNVIFLNNADSGGGISCFVDSKLVLEFNTLTQNRAIFQGGGISLCAHSHGTDKNSIYWNNQAPKGQQASLYFSMQPSVLELSHCLIKTDSNNIHKETGSEVVLGGGLISSDPLFLDAMNQDFHLSKESPCINRAGKYSLIAKDIDGDHRNIMGFSDMGADEYAGVFSLSLNKFWIQASIGGQVKFSLDAGPINASRPYLIFGSLSGVSPGTLLPGQDIVLPINWDGFTNLLLAAIYPQTPAFHQFFGTLDNNGRMTASLNTGGAISGLLVGFEISLAYALMGPPWDFVSNPVGFEIIQ